jgi:prepilin-type N-terminal cleavage/methylation domain-containing protein
MTRKAFTLVELLVVMAITAILLTLIGIPLVQGLNLTRSTQAFAEAQDIAREIQSKINKELSTAVAVLDNSTPQSSIEVAMPLKNGAGQFLNQYGHIFLSSAKLDFVPPAKGDPSNPQFNPGRGVVDPTLRTSVGQVILPVAPGQTIVRYWVGLRRPANAAFTADEFYVNTYAPNIAGANRGTENLFVLYRAEVEPYVFNSTLGRYVPNTALFPVDPNTGELIINDPGFFLFTPAQPVDNITAHRQRLANWLSEAHVMVQDNRTDLIMPDIDETSAAVVYEPYAPVNGSWIPRIRSLVTFQPLRVNNEPAVANNIIRSGEESVDPNKRLAPEFFQTQNPGWTYDSFVRMYRLDPRLSPRPPYYLARWRQPQPGTFQNFRPQLVYFNPQQDADEYNDGMPIFDLAGYKATVDAGTPRLGANIVPPTRQNVELMLLSLDQRRGRIQARFPAYAAFDDYDPQTGVPRPIGATTAVVNAALTGWLSSPTKAQYNPSGDLGRRFIDLRQVAATATATSFNPLAPTVLGYLNPFSKITPGSEVVSGPDQRPGPNFGRKIRYTRVAQGEPVGLNQYKINYTDLPDPNWVALGVPDPGTNNDVRDFIEPRFKKGYIEFYSDSTLPLPLGNIEVSFDFQVNEPGDSVVVDYDSSQRMRVELTIRRFSNGFNVTPQTVTVTDIVAVRNFAK